MYHGLLRTASFWEFLFTVDERLAEEAREAGCPCGGPLHRANYPRQPRGGCANLPEGYGHRLSFCCARDGCRKRTTPPSVRFLGRRVFLGAVVVLVAAMRHGASPRRVRELTELFGVDRRTVERWCTFWREQFPPTPFWKLRRGRFVPRLSIAELPRALLEAFVRQADSREQWRQLLEFLSPITITGGLAIAGIS
jgi:hypothetical protein